MSRLKEYEHIWKKHLSDYRLINLSDDSDNETQYVIYNARNQSALLIEDEDVHRLVVQKMIRNGVEIIPKSSLAGSVS